MGKRSDFERVPRDFYPTPFEAVIPLLPHLIPGTRFVEPCAGDGALVRHLTEAGMVCVHQFDIEPKAEGIATGDATTYSAPDDFKYFITNPPWDRKILHPIISNLANQKRTWLLFDADWMHTRQSHELMKQCVKVVSVGRVKWIPDSKMTGKDNCCWYLFDHWMIAPAYPQFIGRDIAA